LSFWRGGRGGCEMRVIVIVRKGGGVLAAGAAGQRLRIALLSLITAPHKHQKAQKFDTSPNFSHEHSSIASSAARLHHHLPPSHGLQHATPCMLTCSGNVVLAVTMQQETLSVVLASDALNNEIATDAYRQHLTRAFAWSFLASRSINPPHTTPSTPHPTVRNPSCQNHSHGPILSTSRSSGHVTPAHLATPTRRHLG